MNALSCCPPALSAIAQAAWLAAWLAASGLGSLPANAQERDVLLYGAAADEGFGSGPSNSTLYSIDPESGIATEIGSIGFDDVTGLVYDRSDDLLATARDDFMRDGEVVNRTVLIRIDRETGAGTFIGSVDDNAKRPAGGNPPPGTLEKCGRMPDLTIETTSSTLYAMGAACRTYRPPDRFLGDTAVYVITRSTGRGNGRQRFNQNRGDPIPAFTEFQDDGNAIAWDPFHAVFYFASGEDFVDLDAAFSCLLPLKEQRAADDTDRCPVINDVALPGVINGMDFHPLTGVLYGSQELDDDSFLVTIDTSDCQDDPPGPACGAVTTVGQLRDASGTPIDGFDALAFRGPLGCPAHPHGPCRQSTTGGGKLSLSAKKGKQEWKWEGGSTEKSDLGDPVTETDYAVCMTDFSDLEVPALVGWQFVPSGENWKQTQDGFKYKSKDGAPDGVTKVDIKASITPKKARIKLKGKNASLPELPFTQNTRTVIQLINDLGECWDSEFFFPAKKNDEKRFKDKE